MEIETNATNRKELAQAIAEELDLKAEYLKVPTCAYRIGDYTLDKYGILHGDDFEPLQDFLTRNGYLAAETEQTDLVVRIPIPEETQPRVVGNVLRMLYAKQDLIALMTQSQSVKVDEEVITLLDAMEEPSLEKISELVENETKIKMLTGVEITTQEIAIHILTKEDADHLNAYMELISHAVEYVLKVRTVLAKRLTPEEGAEKYHCNQWLVKLGMTGERFKSARKNLLGHLNGCAAFKNKEQLREHSKRHAEQSKLLRHVHMVDEDRTELPEI